MTVSLRFSSSFLPSMVYQVVANGGLVDDK